MGDCDDDSASVAPNADEECDYIDNNCDGEIDEGVKITMYVDNDYDGFGTSDMMIYVCDISEGMEEFLLLLC